MNPIPRSFNLPFFKSIFGKIWPLLVLLLLWLVFWWPVIGGQFQLYVRDLTFYALPMKTYMMARFHAGAFPWWTPHISTGMPFFAEPTHQVLYPFNLLFWITPTAVHGISWFVILHFLFAQWSFYVLCRVLRFNQWLSLWGALLFGYAGYTLSIGDNVNYLPAILWCPLALATFIRGLQTQRLRESALTATSITAMLFAGDTFNPLFLGLFLVLLCLFRWKITAFREWLDADTNASTRWSWIHLGMAFVFAGLLSAVQVLPTQELLALSVRKVPLKLREVSVWSFPVQRTIELIQPYFFGSKYPVPHFIGQFWYPMFREPWADSVYLGLIPVVLAGVALITQFKRHAFWGLMVLLTLVISYGASTPFFNLILDVFPPLNYHRYLEKLVFWVTLGLCVLAVSGTAQVLQDLKAQGTFLKGFLHKTRWSQVGWLLGVLLFGTLFLLKIPSDLWIWAHSFENSLEWGKHFYERGPHVARLHGHWFLIAIPVLLFPLLCKNWKKKALTALCVIAILDLLQTHWGQVPTAPTELLTQRPTPAALQIMQKYSKPGQPIRILFDDGIDLQDRQDESRTLTRISQAYHVPMITDNHEYYWIYRFLYNQNRLLFNFGTIYNVGYQNGRFEPLQQQRHKLMDEVLLHNQPGLLPALSAVDYIVSTYAPANPKWTPENTQLVGADPGFNLQIFKVKKAVSRAYLAPNAIYNPKPEQFFKIATRQFLDHDYQLQVEVAAPEPAPHKTQALTPLNPKAQVQMLRDEPEHIVLNANSPYTQNVYLVLAESLFPGWTAAIDGKEVPIYLANQRFMAVAMPPGQHQIVFQYRSTFFWWGLILSVLGALAMIGCCVWPFCRKKAQ